MFVRSSDTADHEALNLRALLNLLDDFPNDSGGAYILNKIQGVSHGGGSQVPAGTPEFDNMARFLGLLGAAGTVQGTHRAGGVVRHGNHGIAPQDAAPGGVDLCGTHPDG